MGKKRALREEELRLLRYLAARKGCSNMLFGADLAMAKFLKGRGLLSQDNEHAPYQITIDGMVEVAKSGQFSTYNPIRLMERWCTVVRLANPTLYRMARGNTQLYSWIDPAKPWENVENLTYLRAREDLWTDKDRGRATAIVSRIHKWLDSELAGEVSFYEPLIEMLSEEEEARRLER